MSWMDTWLFPLGAVLLGGLGTIVLVRGVFGRWFRAGGKAGRVRSCRRCRFDLSATDGHTCPECGHTARCEAEHYAGRFRWSVAALGLVLLLSAVVVAMTPGIRRDGWLHLLPMGVQVRVFHLEKNSVSAWLFSERLAGRKPRTSMPDRGFDIRASSHGAVVTPEVEKWRDTAVATGVYVMTRERPRSRPQLIWASHLLLRFHDRIKVHDLDRMLKIHGLDESLVAQILLVWKGEPTPEIRATRRELMRSGVGRPDNMARVIISSSLEFEDERVLASFLADSDASTNRLSERSRAGMLWTSVSAGVWAAYADEVRAGRIGNLATLLDGAESSERVTAAAIEYVAFFSDLPEHDQLVNSLFQAELQDAGPKSGLDRERLRGLLTQPSDFKERESLVRLLHRYDTEDASWYMELAREPSHPLRDQAMYEIGRVGNDRERALRFCLDEAWRDTSIGLYHRMWPLFWVRGWDAVGEHELTARWSEVLELAAAGDTEAIKEGLPRFGSKTWPVPEAMLAVARRLVEVQPREPWLEDLASLIAERRGEDPTVQGFAKAFQDYTSKHGFHARHAEYRDAERLIEILIQTDPSTLDPDSQTEPP
jgi:hypothetical protein